MLYTYIFIAQLLFLSGVCGIFFTSRHLILLLIAIEVMFLAINIMIVAYSIFYLDVKGCIMFMVVLTIAGAESALGLAILLIYYRLRGGINIDVLNILKG